MINSFSSVKQLKPAYNYSNKHDFDDDDDVITSASGLRNSIITNKQNLVNASVCTHTDSDYDKKYFRSLESNNNDDESGTNPFENDSLSNTVIFVKNATAARKQQAQLQASKENKNNEKPESCLKKDISDLSLLGVHALSSRNQTELKQSNEENNIGDEVKSLISKIITSIKLSDNFSDDDDDEEEESYGEQSKKNVKYTPDSKNNNNYKYARCDNDYLNEIIDKVINVLKCSNKYSDYLKLYQNQLNSYLKDSLQKYHNQRLVCVMEEILIDISDILCNELTFYTIMNKSRIIKSKISNNSFIGSSKLMENSSMSSLSQCENLSDKNEMNLNLVKSLARNGACKKIVKSENASKENYKRSWSNQANQSGNSWTTNSENNDDDVNENDSDDSSSGTGEKVYFFDGDSFKSKLANIESNLNSNAKTQMGIDLLNKLKFLLKDRVNHSTKTNTKSGENKQLIEDLQFDDLNEDKISSCENKNSGFELKLIKYLSENIENKLSENENMDQSESSESEDENESIKTQNSIEKEENESEIHYKVVDINEYEESTNQKQEISSCKAEENVVEQSSLDLTIEKDLLNNIIMDSIEDGLVGTADALPLPIDSQKIEQNSELLLANQIRNNNDESVNDNQSQNSECSNSNSDNFVYISTASSSDSSSVVEIKKSSLDLDNQEKVLVNNENGSPQEDLKTDEGRDEHEK
jgi:hypothetical protein